MSDIVERLRKLLLSYESGENVPPSIWADAIVDAADEFERLRFELSDAEAQLDKFGLVSPQQYEKDLVACRAEIERLRTYWQNKINENEGLLEENERLRTALDMAEAEIERLRAALASESPG